MDKMHSICYLDFSMGPPEPRSGLKRLEKPGADKVKYDPINTIKDFMLELPLRYLVLYHDFIRGFPYYYLFGRLLKRENNTHALIRGRNW